MTPESPPHSFTAHQLLSPVPRTPACARTALPRRFPPSTRRSLSMSFPPPESTDARDLVPSFGKMPDRTSAKSSLILACTRSKDFMHAFDLFIQMSKAGSSLDEFVLGSLLKASAGLSDFIIGEQLHAKSIRAGLASEPGVRTSLIAMYSTCGQLGASRRVFDEVPPADEHDVPSWNSLMSAYTYHGRCAECFRLFADMLATACLLPTDATYAIVITACASMEDIELGKIMHAMIVKDAMLDKTKMLNSLITLYAKCGSLEDANRVFDAMDGMNIVSWNAIIAGHEQNGECERALEFFRRLTKLEPEAAVEPNRVTFLSVLSAVSSISALKLGREVHARLIRSGLEFETSIGNSIITMYGKCGKVKPGRLVFERSTSRDIVTWNSMLMGYSQNKQPDECCELFKEMQLLGIKADDHTLTILLGAFSSDLFTSDCCRMGREVHGYLLRRSVGKAMNVSVYNAVLTMYAKSNRLDDAEKLFAWMSERDSYSWNAMMDGYSMNGLSDDAVMLFVAMHEQGLRYDHLALSILLTACARLVSIDLGKQFHALTVKHHLNHRSRQASLLSINNSLVSMYAKCGSISDAAEVFRRMARRDVFSWTAMITGYAQHGMAFESIQLFERMKRDGIEPNTVTFLGLLTACSHSGLVDEGTHFFLMSSQRVVELSVEHYACMVDLYGRSGQFDRAQKMVETGISQLGLKHESCVCLWKVLLGACHAHKKLELGVSVAMKILELEPEDEATHVLLSNLYAIFGMWSDAVAVRKLMKERGLRKEAGCSWVEVLNGRHVFVAGDVCHPNRKEIYEKLEELNEKCRDIGYVPMIECVLHDVDDDLKETILSSHSEKLAVSFALLRHGRSKGVIRVIKNLRVCGDCHSWMKFATRVEGREIVLRDSRRFHVFKEGRCSCRDYW